MIEYLLRRGTLLSVAVFIVLIFGILAALRIPVQMIPDLEVRTIAIQTSWPGATPQDVEQEILIEQEEYLRNLPNLQRMISNASTGEATIELEFPFGTNINDALIRVNNALSQVPSYPENVDEPVLFTESFSANAFLYYTLTPQPGNPRSLNMNMMRDFIDDNVRTRMERVPGVSQVELRGGAERQVQISVDPSKLAQRGLTLTEVRTAIRERNRDVSAGDLETGKRRYLLRTIGRFDSVEAFENLIVKRDGDAVTRLRDVAEVQLDHFEIRSTSYSAGEQSILLAVRRETGSNVIAIRDAMVPLVEELRRDVVEPAGMRMLLVTDDVLYVENSIANVWQNLALGALLASAVMFLFLRSVSSTAIGMAGIPVCTIAAFIGLLAAGRTVNVISLAGIAFAIGMTLDNTIVVLENIEQERRKGKKRFHAALDGVMAVWPAVLASTMTTVFVFAPILFIQQEAGQLYSDIAIAISAAILMSMLVAVTIVPAACAHFNVGRSEKSHEAWAPFRAQILASVRWVVGSPVRRAACVALTVGATVGAIAFLTPPAEYLPEGEEPKTFSSMIPPPGYSLAAMDDIGRELQAQLVPHLNADPGPFERGETPVPPLETLVMRVAPSGLRIISMPKNPSHIQALMDALDFLFRSYPGMRSFSSKGSIITSNDGGTRSVNVDIGGPDLESIFRTTLAAYNRARDIFPNAQIDSDPSSLVLGQPLVELRPRWERAAELGFTAQDLGYTIAALTDGAYVDEFFLDDDKIDVFLFSTDRAAAEMDNIEELPVYAPAGGVVPLGALAEPVDTVDADAIRRVNGKRTATLYVIPPRDVALETAVALVRGQVIERMRLDGEIPQGVSIDLSGASDQLSATKEALAGNFAVSIALCYLLLVVIYRHWGYPWIIMATVPLGIAGGIVGLWLMNLVGGNVLPLAGLPPLNQPFDMITMLGFLILLGTVVNNPILIVDKALHNRREAGLPVLKAVEEAVESRIRPIMMTTITTICGLSPLVFIPGAGAELYRGVGAIVLFGLLFSTVVALTFLPALLTMVLNWTRPKLVEAGHTPPREAASHSGALEERLEAASKA